MVHNGILMETIGISVMVSNGLILYFLAGRVLQQIKSVHVHVCVPKVRMSDPDVTLSTFPHQSQFFYERWRIFKRTHSTIKSER